MNTSFLLNKTFQRAALVSAVALGIFGASNSFADKAGTATSTATVIKPISLTVGQVLNFGRFAGSGAIGTVTVTTDDERTSSANVFVSSVDAGDIQAAHFDVEGQADATYSISFTGTTSLFTNGDLDDDMTFTKITSLTPSASQDDTIITGALDVDGFQTIFVGGTLDVGINQPPGAYTGDIVAAVEYN